ncbi:MAG TPA: phosphoribosyltransferase family protein, partial [bacterium]|nr:phosphoribosyltransferase family protein [bacterium]
GSGSSRHSPRNVFVADALQDVGLGTLLFDLLDPAEDADYETRFDIDLLAERLLIATDWARRQPALTGLTVGYFGASTGAAAALRAAAELGEGIAAVVSRGGRPDLATEVLEQVKAATLLIVGAEDTPVIPLNRSAYLQLGGLRRMVLIPGAGHLFEERGTLEQVALLARAWFRRYLTGDSDGRMADLWPEERSVPSRRALLDDRADAGRRLAEVLMERYAGQDAIVVGVARGGVPVAYEIAKALNAPLDVIVVRKLGAPDQPELAIGALVDGDNPEATLNPEVIAAHGVSQDYLQRETAIQLQEIRDRERRFRGGREPLPVEGRTVILADDGIATGASTRAALRKLRRGNPGRLVLATPVLPPEAVALFAGEVDDLVYLATPEPFTAVGAHYRNFDATPDREVVGLLDAAARGFKRNP